MLHDRQKLRNNSNHSLRNSDEQNAGVAFRDYPLCCWCLARPTREQLAEAFAVGQRFVLDSVLPITTADIGDCLVAR